MTGISKSQEPGVSGSKGPMPTALRRILTFFVAAMVMAIVLLAIVILPDQVREVPKPMEIGDSDVWTGRLKGNGFLESSSVGKSPNRLQQVGEPSSGTIASVIFSLDSEHNRELRTDQLESSTALRLFELNRPFTDLSKIPSKYREEAEQLNHTADQITSDFLSLTRRGQSQAFWESYRRHRKGMWDSNQLVTDYVHLMNIRDDQGGLPMAASVSDDNKWTEHLHSLGFQQMLQVAIYHKKWYYAGRYSAALRRDDDAIYYWKKMGFDGKMEIAFHSLSKTSRSLERQLDSWREILR